MFPNVCIPQIWAYLAGFLTVFLLPPLMKYLKNFITGEVPTKKKIYALHHAVLNIEVPPKSMWMNMGYWDRCSGFSTACGRLLNEVLKTADLIDQHGDRTGRHPIKLLDLGIGCCDQTVEMIKEYPSLFDAYIGITIDYTQFDYAHQRLSSLSTSTPNAYQFTVHNETLTATELEENPSESSSLLQKKLESHVDEIEGKKPKAVKIFCADAAKPEQWKPELREAIRPKLTEETMKVSMSKLAKQITWVLALDTLYHFSPSRQLIFNHSYQKLQASIMAFDLLLGDQATIFEQLCVCVLALLMGCPVGNFMTKDEYKTQLLKAGYEEDNIEIKDISEHVFPGLADYIEKRDAELKRYLGRGIGAYKAFGWILRWWARSGVVRGCIVVAKI